MTIQEALDAAREQLDTELSDATLVAWLSNHDEQLWQRALKPYGVQHPAELPYTQYIGSGQDGANEFAHYLIIPDKYARTFYPEYLTAHVSRHHGDYDRWNNGAMAYADMEQKMLNDITREGKWRPPRPDGRPGRPVDGLRF